MPMSCNNKNTQETKTDSSSPCHHHRCIENNSWQPKKWHLAMSSACLLLSLSRQPFALSKKSCNKKHATNKERLLFSMLSLLTHQKQLLATKKWHLAMSLSHLLLSLPCQPFTSSEKSCNKQTCKKQRWTPLLKIISIGTSKTTLASKKWHLAMSSSCLLLSLPRRPFASSEKSCNKKMQQTKTNSSS